MPSIVVKYVKPDPRNGSLIYRRRVPKLLAPHFPQTEIIKVLGRTHQEALVAYGPFHQRIEHMLALARNGVTGLSPAEQRTRLIAALETWGADPFGPGRDDNERTWRQEAAEKLVAPFQDPDTGEYDAVPEAVDAEASALLVGVPKTAPGPSITDAFKFYLAENPKTIPEQRKKQEQRFARIEKALVAAAGSDKQVAHLTRADARNWRDQRIAAGVAPATVRREKNDLHTVIQTAISELLDNTVTNPFHRLQLPEEAVSRQDQREPLPSAVIEGVYAALADEPDKLAIWTLLDWTGARPSEIAKLKVEEIILDDPIPHILIQERDDRTLKTSWSTREVPLIGPALAVAQEIVQRRKVANTAAFPRYVGEGGMDRLSAALNKRVRKLTTNPKHVPYSLRHNMKDRLREADVPEQTQNAIMGHSMGKGEEGRYGKRLALTKKRNGLLAAMAGYRGFTAEAPPDDAVK